MNNIPLSRCNILSILSILHSNSIRIQRYYKILISNIKIFRCNSIKKYTMRTHLTTYTHIFSHSTSILSYATSIHTNSLNHTSILSIRSNSRIISSISLSHTCIYSINIITYILIKLPSKVTLIRNSRRHKLTINVLFSRISNSQNLLNGNKTTNSSFFIINNIIS